MLEYLPMLAKLAGASMQHREAKKANQRSQAEIDRAIGRQRQYQQQADARVAQATQTFDPAARQQSIDSQAVQAEQRLMAPIQQSDAERAQTPGFAGNLSPDFAREQMRASLDASKKTAELARILGKTQAVGRLRQDEAVAMNDAQRDLGRVGDAARGQAGVDDLRISSAGRMNQSKLLMAQLMGAAGKAGAKYGFGLPTPPTVRTVNDAPTLPGGEGGAPVFDLTPGAPVKPSSADWLSRFLKG